MAELLLSTNNLPLDNRPTDVMPPVDRGDADIDPQRLLSYLMNTFEEAIRFKEYLGWVKKRENDIKAYYMQKEIAWSQFPWKGASSYRSPLTATLVDTAWAYLFDSVWPDEGSPLQVKGYGREDQRNAKILELYMNNVIECESNLRSVTNQNIFRMFLHGTGIVKTRRKLDGISITNDSISVENIYVPLHSKGFTPDDTEYVHHVVGLTKNELEKRRLAGVYEFDDGTIAPGIAINRGRAKEQMQYSMDRVTGVDSLTDDRNNLYFIVESYCTYYAKNSIRPIELIAWWAPNGGQLLRVRVNESGIRPFSRYVAYEYPDYFYGMSVPEKIFEIQEKLDYSDKQYTDMMDRASMPAMFLDDTGSFDMNISQRVPGGIYPIGAGNKIIFEPQPSVERGFNEERYNMWTQAEKLTGLIDVVQGASTRSGRTLGETEIRQNAAGVRFSAIFKRYEEGFNQNCKIIYEYQDRYVPRDKKVKLIGFEEYQTVGELFPSNDEGASSADTGLRSGKNYDFNFSGKPISEREMERQNFDDYYAAALSNPVVATNPANFARLLREKARINGIRNHDSIVSKVKEENILTPGEFIQRVMSGQYNLTVRPGVDADEYILEFEIFMRTEMFANMGERGQQFILAALKQATLISQAERQALMDVEQMRIRASASGQAPQENRQAVA